MPLIKSEIRFLRNILCIGAGYVGGPTMAVLATHCPEYRITVVDQCPDKIAAWNSSRLPIYEPGLRERVEKTRGKNLFFSGAIDEEIGKADIIFVTVNTPTKNFGEGQGKAVDLQYIEQTGRRIRDASKTDKIVIEKSTVPVRAAETLGKILRSHGNGVKFEILSNPEFMAEGSAIHDMENPDRILVGSMETPRGLKARDELIQIYERWVPREKIVTANLWSSEL